MTFVLLLAVLVLGVVAFLLLRQNFHVVVPGTVYRSAQPSATTLRRLHEDYGIRSVINLRGTWPGESWFDQESAVAAELDMVLNNIDLATFKLAPPNELRKLVRAFDESPRPILVHCRHGADRTALALAVYLVLFENASLENAMSTYQLQCGHTGMAFGRHLPHLFDGYRVWLAESGSTHSPEAFRQWIDQLKYVGPFAASARIAPPHEARAQRHGLEASIHVTNESRTVWFMRNAHQAGNYVSVRVHDAKGNDVEVLELNVAEVAIAPGNSFTLNIPLKPIKQPGTYYLRVELVDDHG
ncbi:MAG: tyrosine-protein phosphatase, partial [Planctomycetota bacterium]